MFIKRLPIENTQSTRDQAWIVLHFPLSAALRCAAERVVVVVVGGQPVLDSGSGRDLYDPSLVPVSSSEIGSGLARGAWSPGVEAEHAER